MHSLSINFRDLMCYTCHFHSSSLNFVYFGFLCLQVSSVSNFPPTQGGKGDQLFRFICSVVFWEWRDTANKYHWHMWGVLTVDEPRWVCIAQSDVYFPDPHCSGLRVLFKGTVPRGPVFHTLSRSKLLRFSGTPQGHRCRWAVCFVSFPDLSSSENQVLGEYTVRGEP